MIARPPGNLSDKDVEEIARLFGEVPEPEPLQHMIAAIERIVATHKAVARTEERLRLQRLVLEGAAQAFTNPEVGA